MKAVSGLARQVIEGCYHVCRLSEAYKYKGRFIQLKNQWVDKTTGEQYVTEAERSKNQTPGPDRDLEASKNLCGDEAGDEQEGIQQDDPGLV